jgi:hypothetical protein
VKTAIKINRSKSSSILATRVKNCHQLRLHLNEPTAIAEKPFEKYPETTALKSELARIHGVKEKQLRNLPVKNRWISSSLFNIRRLDISLGREEIENILSFIWRNTENSEEKFLCKQLMN